MNNKTITKTQTQFTQEQIDATPKEILEVLATYLEKEINSTKREIMFLETALTRTQEKILPEMNEKLETMISNKESKTKINQQRKHINKCIDDYNNSIDSYNEQKEYLKTLEAGMLMLTKKLK